MWTALGSLDFGVLIPAGIGAVVTVILLAKAVDALFDRFYPYAFHAIIGIVIAATIMIVPVGTFFATPAAGVVNIVCIVGGHRRRAGARPLQPEHPRAGRLRRPFKNLQPEKALPRPGESFLLSVIRFWGSGCPARAC